jgi:hypothetical protein
VATITGPFDDEALNEVGFQSTAFSLSVFHTRKYQTLTGNSVESKLERLSFLKSGKSYHIGRKDCGGAKSQ